MAGIDTDQTRPRSLPYQVLHGPADHTGSTETGTELQHEQRAVRGRVVEPPEQPLPCGQIGVVDELRTYTDVGEDVGTAVGAAWQGRRVGHLAGVAVVRGEDRVEERVCWTRCPASRGQCTAGVRSRPAG